LVLEVFVEALGVAEDFLEVFVVALEVFAAVFANITAAVFAIITAEGFAVDSGDSSYQRDMIRLFMKSLPLNGDWSSGAFSTSLMT
jgi:hypothetical protein